MIGNQYHRAAGRDIFQFTIGDITGKGEVVEHLLDEIQAVDMGVVTGKLLEVMLVQHPTQQRLEPAELGLLWQIFTKQGIDTEHGFFSISSLAASIRLPGDSLLSLP